MADVMVSVTTGVMPWSNSVFHCFARVAGGDWRSAGRVTMVELKFVPGDVSGSSCGSASCVRLVMVNWDCGVSLWIGG